MNKMIKGYLRRAKEIIGKRTPEEIEHDEEVISCLEIGLPIEIAIASAGKKYPKEALKCDPNNVDDIANHYDYLREHMKILKQMNQKKK